MDINSKQLRKIKILNETIWNDKANQTSIQNWVDGICSCVDIEDTSFVHNNILYALENFIYFNSTLVEILLKSAYRDIYEYKLIEKIRKENGNTLDLDIIKEKLGIEKKNTLFIGVGNASESGTHLLYAFRKINNISKDSIKSQSEVLIINNGKYFLNIQPNITRLVLFDDFCGTGNQFSDYVSKFTQIILSINPKIEISYICLIGTTLGIATVSAIVKELVYVSSIFELDESFKVFNSESRYFNTKCAIPEYFTDVTAENLRKICNIFGAKNKLIHTDWAGYCGCELMIGFAHNTPDNTLPFFWLNDVSKNLYALFKRDVKIYE